jgi:hypothetical protein
MSFPSRLAARMPAAAFDASFRVRGSFSGSVFCIRIRLQEFDRAAFRASFISRLRLGLERAKLNPFS